MQIKRILMESRPLIERVYYYKTTFIIVFLIIVILTLGIVYKNNKLAISNYESAVNSLGSKYKKIIYINNNKVKIVYKEKEKIVEKIVYLPQEGNVIVKDPVKPGDDIVVSIKNKGFTLRPGIGVVYNFNKLSSSLDIKFFYFNRYSAGFYTSLYGAGPFFSRHMDDILPFPASNIEIFSGYQLMRYKNGSTIAIGIRSNF